MENTYNIALLVDARTQKFMPDSWDILRMVNPHGHIKIKEAYLDADCQIDDPRSFHNADYKVLLTPIGNVGETIAERIGTILRQRTDIGLIALVTEDIDLLSLCEAVQYACVDLLLIGRGPHTMPRELVEVADYIAYLPKRLSEQPAVRSLWADTPWEED